MITRPLAGFFRKISTMISLRFLANLSSRLDVKDDFSDDMDEDVEDSDEDSAADEEDEDEVEPCLLLPKCDFLVEKSTGSTCGGEGALVVCTMVSSPLLRICCLNQAALGASLTSDFTSRFIGASWTSSGWCCRTYGCDRIRTSVSFRRIESSSGSS